MTSLSGFLLTDNHVCNLPGCACGGAELMSVMHDRAHDRHGPLSVAQAWLQGWPNNSRPWALVWLGNRISDLRFWMWRLAR